RQHSTTARVRPSSGASMAEVAVSARSSKRRQMDALQRTLETPSSAFSQDRPRIRRRERISLVKNRMREFRSSGSARDGGGNVPIYSAMTPSRGAPRAKTAAGLELTKPGGDFELGAPLSDRARSALDDAFA